MSTGYLTPSDVAFDFEERERKLAQRRAHLAAAVKQSRNQGQGQMVGRHYVGPGILNQAMPLIGAIAGQYHGDKLAKEEAQLKADDRRAAIEHAASMPSGYKSMAQGTDYPAMEGEAPIQGLKRRATPEEATQAKRQWAQEGMAIPSRRDVMERVMADIEINEPIRQEARRNRVEDREDRQTEAKATLAANMELRRERLQQQAEAARRRSEDTRLGIEQRRQATQEAAAARLQIAQLVASTTSRRDVMGATAPNPGKTLSNSSIKELGGLEDAAGRMSTLKGEFKPDYAGLKGAAATIAGNNIPGVTTDASEWWKNYRKEAELAERHALFGASLTANEQKAWREADISPSMDPKAIERNLARRAELTQRMRDSAVGRYQSSGYNTEAFPINPPAPREGGASGSFDAPAAPTGPVTVKSVAEAMKLPPGTVFIDPNGVRRTR